MFKGPEEFLSTLKYIVYSDRVAWTVFLGTSVLLWWQSLPPFNCVVAPGPWQYGLTVFFVLSLVAIIVRIATLLSVPLRDLLKWCWRWLQVLRLSPNEETLIATLSYCTNQESSLDSLNEWYDLRHLEPCKLKVLSDELSDKKLVKTYTYNSSVKLTHLGRKVALRIQAKRQVTG